MIGIRDQKPITVDLYDAISKKKEIDLSLNKMSDTISKY